MICQRIRRVTHQYRMKSVPFCTQEKTASRVIEYFLMESYQIIFNTVYNRENPSIYFHSLTILKRYCENIIVKIKYLMKYVKIDGNVLVMRFLFMQHEENDIVCIFLHRSYQDDESKTCRIFKKISFILLCFDSHLIWKSNTDKSYRNISIFGSLHIKYPNLRPYVDIYNHALSFRIFEIDIKIILRSKIQFLTCISSWIIEKYCSGVIFHAMLLSLSCNWMNPNSGNYIWKWS